MIPTLAVRDLSVSFPSEAGQVDAVRGVSFDLAPGRSLGIVGESGSGKSVTALSIMGLLDEHARARGSVQFEGRELLGLSDKQMSVVRGNGLGMIFQDPLTSLTPVYTIGSQLIEALTVRRGLSRRAAHRQAVELLERVGIPEPARRMKSFPHEFSGGMRQRVVIAIAMANNPRLIIADEPTTALDVTIQAQILDLIETAQQETQAALIIITHDMGVVARVADDVVVMYAGRSIETGTAQEIFDNPRMPYTIGLLGAIPRVDLPAATALVPIPGAPPALINLPDACQFAARCPIAQPRCFAQEPALTALADLPEHRVACVRAAEISNDGRIAGQPVYPLLPQPAHQLHTVPREARPITLEVRNLQKTFPLLKGSLVKRKVGEVRAVKGISFDIREAETLAIVGESGSGKTTALLQIMDFAKQTDGDILIAGTSVETVHSRADERRLRRQIQIVFQDPMGSLDPRMTIGDVIAEPLRAIGSSGSAAHQRAQELMALVGLDPSHIDRFPAAFSGGQRQRIGIARALSTNPEIIVLDEPVSALDVSIQAGVLNLLTSLQAELGISYLFVAHDLSVVRHIADRVAVMYLGEFVEQGDVEQIFRNPQHPYTRALLAAVPIPDPKVERTRRAASRRYLTPPTDRADSEEAHPDQHNPAPS